MSTIYKFEDIETGSIYIGKTSRDINARSSEHYRALKRGNHHNPKLQKIFNDNPERLVFSVVCKAPSFKVNEVEQDYILHLRLKGKTLMNCRPNQNPYWLW